MPPIFVDLLFMGKYEKFGIRKYSDFLEQYSLFCLADLWLSLKELMDEGKNSYAQ